MNSTQDQYRHVFDVYWPIGVGVFVLVVALVAFVLIRYRARGRDEFSGGTDTRPRVEIGYAAGLAVVAAFLIWLTLSSNDKLQAQLEQPAEVQIDVTAARWNWRFAYPGGFAEQGTATRIPVLRVPEGVPVRFTGTSLDVIHSFWIPEERFKRDLFPNRKTSWQLTFDQPGFDQVGGKCAEFCGLYHSSMTFSVDVLPRDEFERWLASANRESGGGRA